MIDFHEVRFPEDVSWGSRGGPQFKTQVFTSHRGYEKRNIDWQQPLMQFNVAYGVRTDVQMLSVIEFFNARQGRAHGFRYKNWGNYQIANAAFATGDGGSRRLPIWKFYGYPGARMYRRLRKLVPGTLSGVTLSGTPLIEGTDFNIDYDAGEIALNDVVAYGIPIKCTALEFDEPVRFNVDNIQAVIDAYNSQSLTSLPLIGVRGVFSAGAVFGPTQTATGADDYADVTRLILNFDDTGDLGTTVDQSDLAVPVAFNGTATLTTTAFKHGRGAFSAGLDGHLSLSGAFYDLGASPATAEIFAQRPTTGEAVQHLIGKWHQSTNARSWVLRYTLATRKLEFVISTDGSDEKVILSYPWEGTGAFDYITVDRLLNGWYVFRINGVVVQSKRDFSAIHSDGTAAMTIGHVPSPQAGQGAFQAPLDSIRLAIGRARHDHFEKISVPVPYPV